MKVPVASVICVKKIAAAVNCTSLQYCLAAGNFGREMPTLSDSEGFQMETVARFFN